MKLIALFLVSLFASACASIGGYGYGSYKKNAYHSVAMLQMEFKIQEKKELSSSALAATGFAVDSTHIVTAGHFCTAGFEIVVKNVKTVKDVKFEMYEVGQDEQLYREDGLRIIAVDEKNDLCMIETNKKHNLIPVKISNKKVFKIRDKVFTVGAPSFTFPIESEGFVSLPVIDSDSINLKGKTLLSLSIFKGNSGSPVFDDNGEVIGVIVSGDRSYEQIAIATPVEPLRQFIQKTLHPK